MNVRDAPTNTREFVFDALTRANEHKQLHLQVSEAVAP